MPSNPYFQNNPPIQKGTQYLLDFNSVDGNGNTGCWRGTTNLDNHTNALYASAPTVGTTGIITSGLLLAANVNRMSFVLQPQQATFWLLYGAGTVNSGSGNYHLAISSGTIYKDTEYRGAISAYGSGSYSIYQLN